MRSKDPVKLARNAALDSGVIAAIGIAAGLIAGDVLVAVLPAITLLLSLTGVMIWTRCAKRAER